jgi:hypothetical protein
MVDGGVVTCGRRRLPWRARVPLDANQAPAPAATYHCHKRDDAEGHLVAQH